MQLPAQESENDAHTRQKKKGGKKNKNNRRSTKSQTKTQKTLLYKKLVGSHTSGSVGREESPFFVWGGMCGHRNSCVKTERVNEWRGKEKTPKRRIVLVIHTEEDSGKDKRGITSFVKTHHRHFRGERRHAENVPSQQFSKLLLLLFWRK